MAVRPRQHPRQVRAIACGWQHRRDPRHRHDDGADWFEALPSGVVACIASVASDARRAALFDALRTRFTRLHRARTERALGPLEHRLRKSCTPRRGSLPAMLGQYGTGPVLVVGVGTALTIDPLDADGRHRGGRIAPSPRLMREALHARAAQLPVEGGRCAEFADDTDHALASGCEGAALAADRAQPPCGSRCWVCVPRCASMAAVPRPCATACPRIAGCQTRYCAAWRAGTRCASHKLHACGQRHHRDPQMLNPGVATCGCCDRWWPAPRMRRRLPLTRRACAWSTSPSLGRRPTHRRHPPRHFRQRRLHSPRSRPCRRARPRRFACVSARSRRRRRAMPHALRCPRRAWLRWPATSRPAPRVVGRWRCRRWPRAKRRWRWRNGIKAAGISDLYDERGRGRQQHRAGPLRGEDAARRREAELRGEGFAAQATPLGDTAAQAWLDARLPATANRAAATAVAPSRAIDCATLR